MRQHIPTSSSAEGMKFQQKAESESAPSEAISAPSGEAEKTAESSSEAAPTSAEGDKPAAADQGGSATGHQGDKCGFP